MKNKTIYRDLGVVPADAPTPNARIATMEEDNAEEEEKFFTQIKPTRRNEPRHNVTNGGKDVAWLNANRGEMVGPGTSPPGCSRMMDGTRCSL